MMNRLATGKLPFVLIAIMMAMVLSSVMRAQGNGEKLYNANKCATCHGADGAANSPTGKALKARAFPSDLMVLSSVMRAQGNGEKLYNANKCATCHGADGAANSPTGKALKARDFH